MDSSAHDLTTLLNRARGSTDRAAQEVLFLQVEAELRKIARARLAHRHRPPSWSVTALLHTAWIRLVGRRRLPWRNRRHFYATAALVMRDLLTRSARRPPAQSLDEAQLAGLPSPEDEPGASLTRSERLALFHEALTRLEADDELAAEVFTLRVFGGLCRTLEEPSPEDQSAPEPGDSFLSHEEVAAHLELEVRAVQYRWRKALHFLRHELRRLSPDHFSEEEPQ